MRSALFVLAFVLGAGQVQAHDFSCLGSHCPQSLIYPDYGIGKPYPPYYRPYKNFSVKVKFGTTGLTTTDAYLTPYSSPVSSFNYSNYGLGGYANYGATFGLGGYGTYNYGYQSPYVYGAGYGSIAGYGAYATGTGYGGSYATPYGGGYGYGGYGYGGYSGYGGYGYGGSYGSQTPQVIYY